LLAWQWSVVGVLALAGGMRCVQVECGVKVGASGRGRWRPSRFVPAARVDGMAVGPGEVVRRLLHAGSP
jgi:hypothetical protein